MPFAAIEEIDQAVRGSTVPKRFLETVAAHPNVPALHSMASHQPAAWNSWTFVEFAAQVAKAAAGLTTVGLERGERLLLLMRNRPDFHWFDAAAQFVRGTPVSIYNSSSPEEVQYLAAHAEARFAIVEDIGFAERLLKVKPELPQLERIFVIEQPADGLPSGLEPAAWLLDQGSADLAALAAATEPGDLATLIYTSGTTGPPKGVMLDQHNLVYVVEQLKRCIDFDTFVGKRVVSYLPMAHIAERAMSHYQQMVLGYSVYCCPDPAHIAMYLKEVRPEVLFGVPRVWEKLYLGVNAALSADADKKAQFDGAVAAASAIHAAELDGTITDEQRAVLAQLDAAAFANVRAMIGLDAVLAGVSGAAPIPKSILEWFNAIGVPLSEIYGMSESSGPMTWEPSRNKPGYVGTAIPGCEVQIAEDGEVICRGGNVFQGYLKAPDKTADTLIDGWLHSGDIGEFDDEGYLRIVDRKKELIITSGGKNISPANLEAALKSIPLIGQAAAIGDSRKFICALLVLDPDTATAWAKAAGKTTDLAALARDPDVVAEIHRGVDTVNEQFAPVEQIKRFTLIGEEWLPDSDLLTPTSKLKRRGVNARYAAEIEAMYSGA